MRLKIYCDGLYEPRLDANGYSCWAFVVKDGDATVFQDSGFIGCGREKYSCDVAEYYAVGHALKWMADSGQEGDVYSDSALVVNQVSGRWACNFEHLEVLRDRVRELMRGLQNTTLGWVSRKYNLEADALVNKTYHEVRAKGKAA